MICVYVAATVPMASEGQVNELLESAKQIGEDVSATEEKTTTGKPGADWSPEKDNGADNSVGSFERFRSSFGNPARWAGH